jgi:hypothetical protein
MDELVASLEEVLSSINSLYVFPSETFGGTNLEKYTVCITNMTPPSIVAGSRVYSLSLIFTINPESIEQIKEVFTTVRNVVKRIQVYLDESKYAKSATGQLTYSPKIGLLARSVFLKTINGEDVDFLKTIEDALTIAVGKLNSISVKLPDWLLTKTVFEGTSVRICKQKNALTTDREFSYRVIAIDQNEIVRFPDIDVSGLPSLADAFGVIREYVRGTVVVETNETTVDNPSRDVIEGMRSYLGITTVRSDGVE